MQVGSNTRNQPRCVECGIRAAVSAQRQMYERSGPVFDRWLAGCMAAADKNPRRTQAPGK